MNKSRGLFFNICKLFVTVSFPFFILMFSVILLFRPWFLTLEYSRKSFPADGYGFSQTERQTYGVQSMSYITQMKPAFGIEAILDKNEQPIYLEGEIAHMKDVRSVFQISRSIWFILTVVYVVIFGLYWNKPNRFVNILHAFQMGSYLTLAISLTLIAFVAFAFDLLFDWFHSLFFAEGSWLFYADNTLIRLFPQKLWVDAFIWAGAFTLFFAFLFTLITRSAFKRLYIQS